jgi:hypothetical protein
MYPFCSFVSSTQPTAIRTSLGYHDLISGYMNRHIFAIGTPKKRYSMNRPDIDFTDASRELSMVRAWASQGRKIRPNEAAFFAFDEFFHREIETINFEEYPLMARIDLILRKIMLLLAANDKTDTITSEIVHRALHLYEYIKSCNNLISGNVVSSVSSDLTEWLEKFVQDYPSKHHKPGPTMRDLRRHLPKRFDVKQLIETVKYVELSGTIVPTNQPTGDKGGRVTQRYVYNY